MNRQRNWWWSRQGLAGRTKLAPSGVPEHFGWMRSVGSANPYLAIHARTGAGKEAVETAVAATDLIEIPAARGCTYYVPASDAALGLRLGLEGNCSAEFKMAEKHLDVTDAEVQKLADDIERALEKEPLDPRAISAIVAPRHLGDIGKKRGMTSTLSLGLSRLQLSGKIRRLPQAGRLDTERFRYALWQDGPNPGAIDEATLAREIAERYFAWIGPATEKQFREFAGLSAKLSKLAVQEMVPCPDDPTQLMRPDDLDAYIAVELTEGRAVLLSSIDSWLHLRRNLPSLIDPADADLTLPYGTSLQAANLLKEMDSHPIAMDGVVVGMWEFDHERQSIASWTWRPCAAVTTAIEETSRWIAEELGDFRSFSLDSPKSRIPRIELLRSLG